MKTKETTTIDKVKYFVDWCTMKIHPVKSPSKEINIEDLTDGQYEQFEKTLRK